MKSMAMMVPLAAWMGIGTASAQSSVTLFGIVDTSLSGYWNQARDVFGEPVTTSQTGLTNSAYNSSRLGFRGTEDLGGGLKASFWLEGGINSDDGTGTGSDGAFMFNRRSTVSLESAFGEVRLGRDYTPTYRSPLGRGARRVIDTPEVVPEVTWRSHPLMPHVPKQGLPFAEFYLQRLGTADAVALRQAQGCGRTQSRPRRREPIRAPMLRALTPSIRQGEGPARYWG